jgi:stage II sporulation protein D
VGERSYRGDLAIFRNAESQLCVVNVLGMEEYLFGVVPCEIGPINQQTLEAAKAQAVAARSFTLSRLGRRQGLGHDLFDSFARDQEYRGTGRETEFARLAVLATAGEVLVYHDQPIEALYHGNCGGHTADGSQPYLRGVPDTPTRGGRPFCSGSPNFAWNVTLPLDSLNAVVSRQAGGRRRVRSIRLDADSRSGRVRYAYFTTGQGVVRMHGADVRSGLGLKSQNVTIAVRGTNVAVTGRGWGHGSGLCQDGAIGMARAGRGYRQILMHYYSGVSLKRLY